MIDNDTDESQSSDTTAFSFLDDDDDLEECVFIDIESFITLDSYTSTEDITRPLLSFQALSIETS